MRTFRFGANGPEGRLWMAAVAVLTALAMLAQGCREPVTTYHVAGTKLNGVEKVLVLPFLDTRTFADPNDPFRDSLGNHARDIFAAAMVERRGGDDSNILTPDQPRPEGSLTIAQLAELGRQHDADVVVAGQIFSFTETRAASIPPRAGMFIRVVSAKDGSLLFVGDHYMSAAVPGAPGGRELQARNVSNRLLDGLIETARPLARATLGVASHRALANLSGDMARTVSLPDDAKGETDGAAPVLEFSKRVNVNYDEWKEQPVPELPPILALGDELYAMPPPAIEEDAALTDEEDAGAPEAKTAAESAIASDAKRDEAPEAPETPEADEAFAAVETKMEMETALDDDAVADMAGTDEIASGETAPIEPERERNTAEPLDKPLEIVEAAPEAEESAGAIAPAIAAAAPDDRDAADAPAGIPAGENAVALLPSGDELAEDLFETDPEEIRAMREHGGSGPAGVADGKELDKTSVRFAETAEARTAAVAKDETPDEALETRTDNPVHAEAGIAGAAGTDEQAEAAAAVDTETAVLTQMAYIDAFRYLDGTPAVAEPMPMEEAGELLDIAAPATGAVPYSDGIFAAALEKRDDGPIVSIPLAVEQPRTVRLVDMVELPADPNAALASAGPAVAAPTLSPTAASGAVRVLMLPYHDMENPNNLIPSTGGGEVVTSLYGTQLALDPGIRLMWDSSGQVSHDRLVSIDEALALGRMVGADYVVRGQVVEFRRAQSVPSFYSAIISTAVLAAQIVFAEMSGVDVATEVYRVSDGLCVMSRRDRAQQKYVVQAEKTVRRLAAGMAAGVGRAVKEKEPEAMDPLIDELSPVTVLSNPR